MNEQQLVSKIKELHPLSLLPNGKKNSLWNMAEYLLTSEPYYVHQETKLNTPYNLAGLKKKIFKTIKNTQKGVCANFTPTASDKIEWDEQQNEAVYTYNGKEPIFTLEDALKFSKVDLNVWEVSRHIFNSWQNVGPDGNKNIQIKIWFKRKDVKLSNIIIDMKREMMEYSPKYPKIEYPKSKPDSKMLEINISDLHYGRLAWGEESGDNYDIKIAATRFNEALLSLVKKSSVHDVDKIVFVFGNDFFNADGKSNSTTEGTPQDNDVRWQKMFVSGRKLLVDGIEMLMKIAPVDVVGIYGNHAIQAEFYLGDALECWFHNCKNVSVDNRPHTRKYIQYGESLLGLTHGHEEKVNDLPLLMATEAKDSWSKTKFREFHVGHAHHEKKRVFDTVAEMKSVTVRHLRSLAGSDAWHHRKGYVGAQQSAEAFIWGRDSGIEAIYYHTIK